MSGPGLELVRFERSDLAVLAGWIRDSDEALLWGGPEAPFPLDESWAESLIEDGEGAFPKRLSWSARLGRETVGHAEASIDWRAGIARLARIVVAPDRRGNGLGAAMLGQLVELLFEFPEIHRVEINVYSQNGAAVRLYTRLGFDIEGVRRAVVRASDGYWNSYVMAKLRPGVEPSLAAGPSPNP